MRISIAFGLALAAALSVFAGDQPSIVSGSDEFEFIYRVKLPAIDGKARLWMPLAKTSDVERAKALYDHVLGRMRYDKSGTGWGRGDAMFACDARTGNCTDFHAYFIALARSIGIPARFAIGATIPAEKNEGVIDGYHCWAEFFAGGRWIPVDISEAWKNPKLAHYYFGHNPANRFELTKGRDLVVDPEPASGPINFLIYPLLEIRGKMVKAETTITFRRIGT